MPDFLKKSTSVLTIVITVNWTTKLERLSEVNNAALSSLTKIGFKRKYTHHAVILGSSGVSVIKRYFFFVADTERK
jgi:hypothetical protein